MTVRRADILAALKLTLDGSSQWPAPVSIDASEPEDFLPVTGCPGLLHTADINGGVFTPDLRTGPDDQWEGTRDVMVTYLVQGADRGLRQARAAQAVVFLEDLVRADRTLGVGDPQVWAEIASAEETDVAMVDGATSFARASVTFTVTYVAASAAG